ncbi:class I adenylate-forming enzyme family protein [Nocardia concava]|uniref:class I adenylate-forming enzyme family protein n=1 Tax=Nocardia concava TaxID=257281 RepID=UPI0002D6E645|nr:class I adenylate-forming enzyme family protein [Nocardia concava]
MLYNKLAAAAARFPTKTAIIHESASISYADLDAAVQSFSSFLTKQGVERRTVVGLHADNSIAYVVAYLAAARNDLIVVPLDVRYTEDELTRIIDDCRPAFFICDHMRPVVGSAAAGGVLQQWRHESTGVGLHFAGVPELPQRHPRLGDDDFVIQYSSGSTGRPKGILLTQVGLANKMDNWCATLEIDHDDVFLNTLTLSHCYGLYVHTLAALFSGSTLVMVSLNMITPKRVALLIEQHGATVFGSLPYMFQLLTELPQNFVPDFSQVRYFISGSAPLNEKTAREFYARFGRHINQVFGLTEIGLITFNKVVGDPMSTGRLTVNMEARVLAENGSPCTDGEVGELVVRCASLANGYLSHPGDEQEMFVNGWLHTKDFVYRQEGAFYVAGRKSQFINVGGNKVSPSEIEACLVNHPGVVEVAVVGVADDFTGQRVVAFVRGDSTLDSARLLVHCRDFLAPYKVPQQVIVVPEIPKSPLGKVLRDKLIQVHASQLGALELMSK